MNYLHDIKDSLQLSRVNAVEIHLLNDGTYIIHHITLKRKGTRLEVTEMHPALNQIDELSGFIKKGSPIVLVITGKGIIIRTITKTGDGSKEMTIKQILPDSHPDDFILCQESIGENESVLCLIRKETAEKIIKMFDPIKPLLVDLFIGPLAIAHIGPLFDNLKMTLATGFNIFHFNNGKLIEIQTITNTNPPSIHISNLTVPGELLCAFSSAVTFLLSNCSKPQSELASIRNNANTYSTGLKIKKGITVTLGLLFILLLGNFIVFGHYSRKLKDIDVWIQQNEMEVRITDSLQRLILQHERLLAQSSRECKWKWSYLIDQLGPSIPVGITLTEIHLCPLSLRSDEESMEPEYHPGKMTIRASVVQSKSLNQWMRQLEKMNWIESVDFSDYREKENNETGVILEIILK
jgi:hypothetical protein